MKEVESIRSEEIQEVLTKIPRKIIKWGNAIILLCVLGIFVLTANIPYPDKINCEAELSAKTKPFSVNSKKEGVINKIIAENEDQVSKNDIILTLSSKAKYEDIKYLKSILDSIDIHDIAKILPSILNVPYYQLGTLNESYLEFESAYLELYKLSKSNFNALKENSKFDKLFIVERKLKRLIEKLKSEIIEWEEIHIYRTEEDGILYFPSGLHSGISIEKEELLFSVYSKPANSFFTELKIHKSQLDKINVNQKVLIQLSDAVEIENNVSKGYINHIDTVPDKSNQLTATITLLKDISSELKNEILKQQKIQRPAVILLNDKSLLSTLLNRKNGI